LKSLSFLQQKEGESKNVKRFSFEIPKISPIRGRVKNVRENVKYFPLKSLRFLQERGDSKM